VRDDLPTGTVTFLFTDVEGSTKLLHSLGAESYAEVLAEHRRIIRDACTAENGVEVDTQGDAFFFAFPTAPGALAAATELTESLAPGPIHVRVGLHTGTPLVTDGGYVGGDVHRAARIAAVGHGGQVLVGGSTAALVGVDGLVDLGEHRFKDLATPERVYQLGDETFPPLRSLYRSNLPLAANPLVGRKKELADVLQALLDGSRAVTVTGPGGVGKTRFALAVANEATHAFPDGVWFVPLAALRDPALVLPTVAEVIGADDDLHRHIGDRACLLFLDNFEQIVDAAGDLATLVGECPRLRLLVTSREALRIAFEREYPLSPLPGSPSVELFRQRVDTVAPEREIEYATAVEICDRLDRLPLAIELAAARCKALSPEQILERLSESLDFLRGGRDADPRQQTLRATIEWSCGLLSEEEQRIFRALSVFRGGCTLHAAEEICDADIDAMQSLVEKSLLRFTRERYWLLETIREFAREQLGFATDEDQLQDSHAGYFLALLQEKWADALPPTPDVQAWYATEVDNLRAMVERLLATAPEDAARAVNMLFRFWKSRGAYEEAGQRLQLLSGSEGVSSDIRAEVLARLAEMRERLGDFTGAETAAVEALELSGPSTNARVTALLVTSARALDRGDADEGVRLARAAVEEARGADVKMHVAALGDLGETLVIVGRRDEARDVIAAAIGLAEQNGLVWYAAWGSGQLGLIDLTEGAYDSAREVLEPALAQARSVGFYVFEAEMLHSLGYTYIGLERRRDARRMFGTQLELALEISHTAAPDVVVALSGIALAVEPGDYERGAQLRGAIASLRENRGGLKRPQWRLDEELERRFGQPLIDALGKERYAREQTIGAMMSLEETLMLARAIAGS
jgi:predicted ATPase/class 3 adenylate cyclase